jgi:diguanylate cyclase (GGDEF)-like protein
VDDAAPPTDLDPIALASRVLALAQRMPHLLGVADGAGRIVWLNDAGRRFVGTDPGAALTTADLFTEDVFQRYYATIRPALVQRGIWWGELPVRRAGDAPGVVDAIVVGEVDDTGEARWVACLAIDVTEQHEREARLSHRASHDPLTGLPNRALLRDRLGVAVAVAQRVRSPVAVLALDLDGFKDVNDRHGHAAGDELLQQVAARIKAAVRPADTVARLGGDEFVVVVHPPEETSAAVQVAERIRDQIALMDYVVGDERLQITTSIGLTVSEPGAPVDPVALLRAADRGMYRAKRSGGNTVRVAGSSAPGIVDPVEQVGDELARGLAEGRILSAFEPVVDLASGELCAVQAHARWDHPDRGVIAARDFVEAAAVTGYADLVWWAAARRAVRAAADAAVPVPVHLTMSTSQLRGQDLVDRLGSLRGLAGEVPLHLKADARSLLELVATGLPIVDVLADIGLGLVLGGHGLHNLPSAIMASLPVSAIELDVDVVRSARSRPRALALATRASAALDVPCIAQVESEAELPMLAVLGVTAARGRVNGSEWDAERLRLAGRATRPRP